MTAVERDKNIVRYIITCLMLIMIAIALVGCGANEAVQTDTAAVIMDNGETETNVPTYEPTPEPSPAPTEPEPEPEEESSPDIYTQVFDLLTAIDKGVYVPYITSMEIDGYLISLYDDLTRRRELVTPHWFTVYILYEYLFVDDSMGAYRIPFDVVRLFPHSEYLNENTLDSMIDISLGANDTITATVSDELLNVLIYEAEIGGPYFNVDGSYLEFQFNVNPQGTIETVTMLFDFTIQAYIPERYLAYMMGIPLYMDFEMALQFELGSP